MALLPRAIAAALQLNSRIQAHAYGRLVDFDPPPVRLSLPDNSCVWFITEIAEFDHDRVYGLGQIGRHAPTLAWHSLTYIGAVRGVLGTRVAFDPAYRTEATLSQHVVAALKAGRLIDLPAASSG